MMLKWTWARFDDLGVHALHDALALRCKVFILEQGPYQDPDGADKQSYHLLGYNEAGALQACLRVVDPGVNYPEPSIGRVVTAKLPDDLVSRMDEIADRIDRSKSWIVRQALSEWLAEEERRYELTLEALKDIDEGRTIPHEEVLAMVEQRKRERRQARSRSAA